MYLRVKWILDRILAFLGLIVFSPFFFIITIALFIVNNSNPFFTQYRPGKNEKIFKLIKFKSMTDELGVDGELLSDAQRLTKIGNFIRKTSLDELPQLFNVLKGEMSMIGPRPLLPEYLPYYTKEETLRHTVRPGITGLAQVLGRNNLSWENKLQLDVEYVHNMSLKQDVSIFLLTIKNVIICKDIVVISNVNGDRLDYERKEKI
ncbi:sugar transferase [Ancylomarina sp. 16SWW S1-10-2]|uniref:sugar transferase n=1 Tax=Ancylomarina sp. 16SWW S1-10-2 TaxID=2499681 RepID=UPI0012AE1417|nr:sugar transferase [Ancylomarina sp. 16SWW S1-10-2]MRT93423.1 sugar transferase [Ancylomarina sp. 16SWW S1-10-2]